MKYLLEISDNLDLGSLFSNRQANPCYLYSLKNYLET